MRSCVNWELRGEGMLMVWMGLGLDCSLMKGILVFWCVCGLNAGTGMGDSRFQLVIFGPMFLRGAWEGGWLGVGRGRGITVWGSICFPEGFWTIALLFFLILGLSGLVFFSREG